MSDAWAPIGPLGEALHVLRMGDSYYSRCAFTAPWGLVLPELPGSMMFHVVTTGRCWIDGGDAEPRLLHAGDLALVPHGGGHRLASEPGLPGQGLFDLPREQVSERYEVIRQEGGGEAAGLLCGTVRFEHPAARQLIEALPRFVIADSATMPRADWLRGTVGFLADEAAALRPGGETIVTRLADVLVIQAIRSWIERDPAARSGWLGALRDPQVGRAIALIHREPGRDWTVAALAHEVAMSRSAFAARFADLAGETPMRYLARWRMQVAAATLAHEDATLGELADRLGYGSEAAFARAFKRLVGVPPGAIRRTGSAATSRWLAAGFERGDGERVSSVRVAG